MDQTTYPGSETDINEVYDNCDFLSTASNDFVERWVNLTVEKEILRGTQLREEKLKSYPELLECEVVNVNVDNPTCFEDPYFYRKCSPERSRGKTVPCSLRSNSPFVKNSLHSRCTPQPFNAGSTSPNKYATRCPLRIAELAVPTKRQCIDTWRNKCNVLPAFMVERLRQQVMDEKPVVEISDAVSCFARRRPKSLKSGNKRSKKPNRETKQKIDRDAEIRELCAAFAGKIARKLITPRNLNLNPELDKLSKVVANEITKIIKKRKKYGLDINTQNRIHADIASKIAVWIATILEDSSYKLLEDDLRELEDQEGPVLDFIDDLIKNVVTVCEPDAIINMEVNDVSETTSKAASNNHDDRSLDSKDSIENNEFGTSTLYKNVTYDTGEGTIAKSSEVEPFGSKTQISAIQEIDNQSLDQNDVSEGIELTINDHIQEEINKILDSVTESNTMATESEQPPDTSKLANDYFENEIDLPSEFQNIQESPGNSELTHNGLPLLNLDDDAVSNDSNILKDGDDNKYIQILGSEADNVTEAFELSEESPDEKYKKVKFSEIDMALRGRTGKLVDSTENNDRAEIDKILISASTHSIRLDLVLAPPNKNLLSDADESWPVDIRSTALKPSASVNRSITSLGRILEKDEKLFMTEDNILSALNLDDTHKKELLDNYEQDINTEGIGELEKKRKKEIGIHEDSITTSSSPDSSTKEIKSSAVTGTTILNMNQKTINKPVTQYYKTLSNHEVQGTLDSKPEIGQFVRDDIKNLESDTNFIYEAVQQKMKTSYALLEQKFDYKVHPNTAPSWLRNDNGKGEPSEDSFRDRYKIKAPKFKDSNIRSWCNDLDRIFINLEMWNGWMETTCKNVLYLKQKRDSNKLFSPSSKRKNAREWVTLKNNIDKDAVLWNKLNQRALERLKSYKEKAKIVSTEYCMACDCKNNARRKM